MPQEIKILIPKDHKKDTRIEVNGVKGEGCAALTRGIEEAIGATTHQEKTGEFYEGEVSQEQTLGGS